MTVSRRPASPRLPIRIRMVSDESVAITNGDAQGAVFASVLSVNGWRSWVVPQFEIRCQMNTPINQMIAAQTITRAMSRLTAGGSCLRLGESASQRATTDWTNALNGVLPFLGTARAPATARR